MSFIGSTTAYPLAVPVSGDRLPFIDAATGALKQTDVDDLPSSNAAAFNSATAFDAFGDSITDGTGASAPANEYVALLAAARGWTVTNHAVSGDMVADQADPVFTLDVGNGQQSTLMLGTNDMRTYTSNVSKRAAFKAGHAALLAWLAIPDARKQKGQGRDSVTGTWTNTSVYDGGSLGIQSIVPTSTATFTAYGSVVYVATILQNSIVATFSLTVDGVNRGTYSCAPGATITSVNGLTYMPALVRIPGLTEGPHTVVITVVSASTSNPVYVLWVAGNLGHATKGGPNVWCGNVPRFTSAGYTASGGSDGDVAAFNAMIRDNVRVLSADGLNVALVDSAARLAPATDLDTDGVHPDDSGHSVIAEAFLEAINQAQKPRTMQPPVVDRDDSNALSTSGAIEVDYRLGDYFTLALAGNVTSWSFANLPGSSKGVSLLVRITQDATPRTVAWPSSFKWAGGVAPSVSTGSGAVDVLGITSFDNGTTWQATLAKAFA